MFVPPLRHRVTDTARMLLTWILSNHRVQEDDGSGTEIGRDWSLNASKRCASRQQLVASRPRRVSIP